MKKLLFAVCLGFTVCGCSASSEPEQEEVVELEPIEMNKLQELFCTFSKEYNLEDLTNWLSENPDVFYSEEVYNGSDGKELSYQLAFTDEDTAQKYRDSDGDFLRVEFLKSNGEILNAEYDISSAATAMFYNKGVYWEFSDQNAEDYSGFYLNDWAGSKTGLVIKSNNGSESETHYFPYASGEEALQAQAANVKEK